jgi:DNA-binding NarL/FixJ family response regulator
MQSGRSASTVSNAPSARRVRVVVADPFPIVLLGVRTILEDHPHLQIVGELSTMQSLLETVIAEVPDIAVVDWSMASQDLNVTTVLFRSDLSRTSLVFLTSSEDAGDKRKMIRLGVRDLVSKRASPGELQTAVWNAWNRSIPSGASASKTWSTAGRPGPGWADPQGPRRQLTRRERQLIPLVCRGMRNKEIAQHLGIAESTVWHHLTAVFTKLEVDDRMGLAALAYRQGLLVPAAGLSPTDSLCKPTSLR